MLGDFEGFPRTQLLIEFVRGREMAREWREHGNISWSAIPKEIREYRYCNVRRADDTVSKWIALHWQHNVNTVPAMLMARLFNQPETLAQMGYPHNWDEKYVFRAMDVCKLRKEQGQLVFNPAYIVSTNGKKMDKVEYVMDYVLDPVFHKEKGEYDYPELEDTWRALTSYNGVGSFMAAQVVADLKNIKESKWATAPDFWTFCAPGPGSQRGLNRLRGLGPKEQHYSFEAFKVYIQHVRRIIYVHTGIRLCAQDAQNVLCEFDKYMRLVLGEGRPKQLYKGRV